MIFVRTQVAGTADRSQHALAVRTPDELPQYRGSPVGPLGLRRPPALLHDNCHRPRGRARGAFVFETLLLQAPLHLPIVPEKRRMPPLHDLPLGQRRNLAIAGPLQRLGMQRKALPIQRASGVNPPDLLLQPRRNHSFGLADGSEGRLAIGKSGDSHGKVTTSG